MTTTAVDMSRIDNNAAASFAAMDIIFFFVVVFACLFAVVVVDDDNVAFGLSLDVTSVEKKGPRMSIECRSQTHQRNGTRAPSSSKKKGKVLEQ